jgi:hypothetical protein
MDLHKSLLRFIQASLTFKDTYYRDPNKLQMHNRAINTTFILLRVIRLKTKPMTRGKHCENKSPNDKTRTASHKSIMLPKPDKPE